jgi:hypothetical protein
MGVSVRSKCIHGLPVSIFLGTFAISIASGATLSVPPVFTVAPDEPFAVPVQLSPAAGVLGCFFDVVYDSTAITFQGASNGALTSSWPQPGETASSVIYEYTTTATGPFRAPALLISH